MLVTVPVSPVVTNVPVVAGIVIVVVPAVAVGTRVIVPEVAPGKAILEIPVSAKLAEDLFNAIDVVPIFTVEFPNTPEGIVPVRFAAVRFVKFAPDTVPSVDDHVPVVTFPTAVSEEVVTPEPRVVEVRTEVLLIL